MLKINFYRTPLLFLLLIPAFLYAQPKLTINSTSSFPPDTVYYPNTVSITYRFVVENVGNNQLTGPCQIRFKYNTSSTIHTMWNWLASNFEVGQTDTIILTDSIGVLGTGRYKGGDNIIVIWPHSDNPNTLSPDTTNFPIWIEEFNSAPDPSQLHRRVVVFPSLASEFVYLRQLDIKYHIKTYRIVTVEGKVLRESIVTGNAIQLSGLTPGLYFLKLQFSDGLTLSFKITKL